MMGGGSCTFWELGQYFKMLTFLEHSTVLPGWFGHYCWGGGGEFVHLLRHQIKTS